ncbi:MAG: radical SAM protein [Deltaproteobacteria bacterium]|nr:radical SAM protein [Deltaproteobacteria bacterium]
MGVTFQQILSNPEINERWQKVKKYFFLRESTYDMTNRCNLRCDGCYYYEGAKQFSNDERDPGKWRALMTAEKERGITFVVLAGAEPGLVPELCQACYDVIPLGCIASNGLRPFPEGVGYRIHVSVWGDDAESKKYRGRACLDQQLQSFKDDDRAIFVYTFTRPNIDQAKGEIHRIADHGGRVTFNMFSPPVGYKGDLTMDAESFRRARDCMLELLERYPGAVLYSRYSAEVHCDPERSLHQRFRCPYPRCNPDTRLGLGRSFRQYRSDLTWDRSVACCVPDTDCGDCRHYASGSAIVTSRMAQHVGSELDFEKWLDYVDTYLAVWVRGYEKGRNLYT